MWRTSSCRTSISRGGRGDSDHDHGRPTARRNNGGGTEEEEDQDEDIQAAIASSTGAALPTRGRDDDDDSPREPKFKCTVPGCDRTFNEHHELKCTSSYLGTMWLLSDSIPQPTLTSTTINRTHAQLKGVTGLIPLNARGTGMYPFIVSRDNSDCRALVLLATQRRQKRQQKIRPLSLKLRQLWRCHPCSFLPHYLPVPTLQMHRWLEIRHRHNIPKTQVYII
jgi:hypothetical protein